MPSAKVTFISGNWVNNYTSEDINSMYNEIVNYFTEEVLKEVLSKYDNSLDIKPPNV